MIIVHSWLPLCSRFVVSISFRTPICWKCPNTAAINRPEREHSELSLRTHCQCIPQSAPSAICRPQCRAIMLHFCAQFASYAAVVGLGEREAIANPSPSERRHSDHGELLRIRIASDSEGFRFRSERQIRRKKVMKWFFYKIEKEQETTN